MLKAQKLELELDEQKKRNGKKIQEEKQLNIIGHIVDELVEGEPCPVCGSPHHPNKAKSTIASISEESIALEQKKTAGTGNKLSIAFFRNQSIIQ